MPENQLILSDGDSASLMQQFVEGTISPENADLLLAFLQENPSQRRLLAWHVDLDSVLRAKVGPTVRVDPLFEHGLSTPFLDIDKLAVLEREAPVLPSMPAVAKKKRETKKQKPKEAEIVVEYRRKKFRRKVLIWSGISTCVLFVLSTAWFAIDRSNVPGGKDDSVARIIDSIDAVWDEGAESFKAGQKLESAHLKLKSGLVKLLVGGAVQVTLEGPTELVLKTKDKTFCPFGKLSVRVGAVGKGFEIATPMATLVDHGTAFAMSINDKKAEVHVVEGSVEIRQTTTPSIRLTANMASTFDLTGRREIPYDVNVYFSDSQWRSRVAEYVARRSSVWNQNLVRMQNDEAILQHYVPKAQDGQSELLGSRPERVAVCFSGPKDRRDISVMKESKSLTLMANVMPRELTHVTNTLLIGDDFYTEAGQFVWQLDRSGFLQFHVNTGGGQFGRYDSGPVVHRKDWGTWLLLALVVDAENKTVTHYVDGHAVSEQPWSANTMLVMKNLSLGDERPGRKKSSFRFFNGCMEECWILARALSAEEIERFYRDNR